jgi:hypothetical protein
MAIESEWRARLAGLPGVVPGDTLGALVRAVREMGEMGKAMLRQRLGAGTRLCDGQFLSEMLDLLRFLNGAAHPPGLERDEVVEWRRRLYRRGLLSKVLGAVQGSP